MSKYIHKKVLTIFPDEIIIEILNSFKEFESSYKNVFEKLSSLAQVPLKVEDSKVIITNWLDVLSRFNGGDCVDIAIMLLGKWEESGLINKLEELGYTIIFAEGSEPQFFNKTEDNHAFILIENQSSSIVVDPALQIIDNLETSGYSVREKTTITDILQLNRGNDRVIDLNSNLKESAVIGITDNSEYAIGISFKSENGKIIPFTKLFKGSSRVYLSENSRDDLDEIPIISRVEIEEVLNSLKLFHCE
jgi:hypothetical protein